MDYDKFVTDYIEALKSLDGDRVLALIDTLETEAERDEAFERVLKALDADTELKENNPRVVEILESIKKAMLDRAADKAEVADAKTESKDATEEVKTEESKETV